MEQVAEGLHRIPVVGADLVNTYLVGEVIVDAGTPKSPGKTLLKALEDIPVSAHAITHAHLDHLGGSRELSETLSLPVWAPERDADAVEAGEVEPAGRLVGLFAKFDSVPVSRRLYEGDELTDGFVVVDARGHSPGHVAFWRESDRVLIAGDCFVNINLLTRRRGLRDPPKAFTVDVEENKRSQRKLAELEPDVVVFGHGPVLRDAAPVLAAFVERNS